MNFIAQSFEQLKRMLIIRNILLDISTLEAGRANMVGISKQELDLFYDDLVEAKEDNTECDNDLLEHFEE